MKSISNHKLFAGFALALALLVGVAVVNWRHLARMEETAALVAHTERVRDELQGLLLTVVDVETAMRGFVLTGEPDFLKPLEDGVQRVSDEQRVLESLIIDGKQKASLDLLQPLVTTRIASAQALVETHRKFGAEAALKEILTQKGKRLTDQIRGQIARMDARAGALVEQQSAAAKTAAQETRVLMATGLSMSVVLLITVFAGARRENRLRQQAEAQRDRFFDLSLDLLCIAGTDGYYKQLSPAFSQTLGWSGEEILERPYLDFVHPDDRAATLAEVEKLTHGVPSILFENRYQCKDGSWKWLSWRAQPFPSEGLLYATARDVTEHKQAGERVEQLNADLRHRASQLEEANKELEAFSYSISHDLRAPLRHVAGFVDLLRKELGESASQRGGRFLKIIADSARQMGQLIDALLAFSRMSRIELQETMVDANQIVEGAIANLKPEIEGRNILWKKTNLPRVKADPALLRQVFVNLLSNAVKYSAPRDPAQIEIGHQENENEIVIFIRDNGVGFDMNFADKLFGVFQRLHRADEFEGTGVGLANVRRIIQRHGGRTWAEGKLDGGATFSFSLPKTKTNI